jgi:hypothetical protein
VSETPEVAAPILGRRGRKPWQVGLRTTFLMTAAIAAWVAFYANRREITMLQDRISTLQPLARELVIKDPAKTAVVQLDSLWQDENRWDVYLPAGSYRVRLATRGIDLEGPAPATTSAPIASGRHRLALDLKQDGETRRIAVAVDGARLLEAVEPKEWDTNRSSTTNSPGNVTAQEAADRPLLLIRRRNFPRTAGNVTSATPGACDGLLLWIERAEAPKPD